MKKWWYVMTMISCWSCGTGHHFQPKPLCQDVPSRTGCKWSQRIRAFHKAHQWSTKMVTEHQHSDHLLHESSWYILELITYPINIIRHPHPSVYSYSDWSPLSPRHVCMATNPPSLPTLGKGPGLSIGQIFFNANWIRLISISIQPNWHWKLKPIETHWNP